ncbi:MAG: toxin-antitoxin system HicB family antitoxin [Pseudomonadota bacterium]
MTTMSLRLPDSLHRQLKALAERDGVSMNHMVTLAVAEKTAALLTVAHLEQRAERGDRSRFEKALAAVPDVEPETRDRIADAGSSRRAQSKA